MLQLGMMCYALFSDRKNGLIGVARFSRVWPGWHRILWSNSHALIARRRPDWAFFNLCLVAGILTALSS
jgi:hypothetical protein